MDLNLSILWAKGKGSWKADSFHRKKNGSPSNRDILESFFSVAAGALLHSLFVGFKSKCTQFSILLRDFAANIFDCYSLVFGKVVEFAALHKFKRFPPGSRKPLPYQLDGLSHLSFSHFFPPPPNRDCGNLIC